MLPGTSNDATITGITRYLFAPIGCWVHNDCPNRHARKDITSSNSVKVHKIVLYRESLQWAECSVWKEDKPPSPQVFSIMISSIPVRGGIPKFILQPWSCLLALCVLVLIKDRDQLSPFFSWKERQLSTDGPIPVKKKTQTGSRCDRTGVFKGSQNGFFW